MSITSRRVFNLQNVPLLMCISMMFKQLKQNSKRFGSSYPCDSRKKSRLIKPYHNICYSHSLFRQLLPDKTGSFLHIFAQLAHEQPGQSLSTSLPQSFVLTRSLMRVAAVVHPSPCVFRCCYSNMLQSMDELIIAGTSSLSRAIKSIQCLRQHELPHHTWQKPSPCVGKHDVLLI